MVVAASVGQPCSLPWRDCESHDSTDLHPPEYPPHLPSSRLSTPPGEVMLGDLVRHGFNVTDDHEGADAVVINTCAFVEDAKAESLEVGTWKSCKLECRV